MTVVCLKGRVCDCGPLWTTRFSVRWSMFLISKPLIHMKIDYKKVRRVNVEAHFSNSEFNVIKSLFLQILAMVKIHFFMVHMHKTYSFLLDVK